MKTQFRFLCFCLAMLCGGIAFAQTPLSGTLTVPSTAYPTLKSAIDSLNFNGISGAVTVSVTAGNAQTVPSGGYRLGSATLNATTSSTNTLTINGNGNTATSYVGTGGSDGIFYIQGTDYVTINSLNLTDPSTNTTSATQMEWGYVLCKLNSTAPFDGCQYDLINGCTVSMNMTNSVSTGILIAHIVAGSGTTLGTTPISAAGANSYNQFTGNTLTGVSRGVFMSGIANSSFYGKSNVIGGTTAASGNTIVLGGSSNTVYGVYTIYDSTITIQNNIISTVSSQSGNIYGIYTGTGTGDLNVIKNNVSFNCNGTSLTIYGFYNSIGGHADASTNLYSTHDINGNTFTGTNASASSGSFYAIYEYYAYCLRMKVHNNNIHDITFNSTSSYTYFAGIYTYYNGAPYLNVDSNSLYNLNDNGSNIYYYGLYCYHYNSPYGLFSAQSNVQRKINMLNGYLMYAYYLFGSGTTPPTGYSGQILRSKYNVLDSFNCSGPSYNYLYNYFGFYGMDSSECSYNTVSNLSVSASGYTYMQNYFGYGYYATTSYKSSNNSVYNINGGGAYAYNYMGYYCTNTDSNKVYNYNLTGSTIYVYNYIGFYGKSNRVSYNKVNNINVVAGSVGNYLGYYETGGDTVRNNTVSNINLGGSASYTGYFGYYTTGGSVILQNRVDSITTNGGTIEPFYVYANGGTTYVRRNILSNLISNSTTPTIHGYNIQSTASPTVNIYNNIFSNLNLPSGYNSANGYCMNLGSTSGTVYNVYHNTLYANVSLTGGSNFSYTGVLFGTSGTLDLRNNIINVNLIPGSSGYVVALRRSSGTSGVAPTNLAGTSNGNILYAPNLTNSWLYGAGSSAAGMVNTYNLTNDASFNTPCGLWKSFVGSNSGTFTENNLTAGSIPATYLPTGTSYAKHGAVPTPLNITIDYSGATRSSLPDMGALEFSGTALDAAPPAISFTPLPSQTYCTSPLSLVATITDQTGVRIATGNAPRLYYKKSTDNNTFGANNSSTNGWKYVEATSISGSAFTFNFDYTLLQSTLATGDSITYFVIAEDSTTSFYTGATVAGFSTCPSSVSLSSTNGGGVNNSPAPYGFKVQTTPTFLVSVSPKASCGAGSTIAYLSPGTLGANIQWQSASLTGSFANLTGATAPTYTSGVLSTTTRYQAVITCGSSALATSSIDTFLIANPSITSTTGATRCGYGTVNLVATPGTSTVPRWYTAMTGGTAIYNGTTFATPNIVSSVTYYVSGVTPNGSTESVTKAQTNPYGPYFYYNNMEFTLRNNSTHFYSTTIYPSATGTVRLVLINTSGTVMTNSSGACYVDKVITSAATGFTNGTTVQLNYLNLPPGQYWLVNVGIGGNAIALNHEYLYPTFAYPYYSPSGNVSIDAGGYNYNSSWTPCNSPGTPSVYAYMYGGYYNNVFSGECESSTRTPVTATITPAPAISVSSNRVPGICAGDTATFTVTSVNGNYAYGWSPCIQINPCSGSGTLFTSYAYPTAQTTYRLLATDPYTGCANSDTIRLFVNPKPAAPSISPVSPIICQKGQVNLKSTSPPGVVQTTQYGSLTNVSSASQYSYSPPTALANYYPINHSQFLIRASEIQAHGQGAGNFTSLQLNVSSVTGVSTMRSFTLKIGGTTLTALAGSTLVSSGFTTVYSNVSYSPSPVNNWVTINFTTPYSWNGTDNIVVDLSANNNTICPTYSYIYNGNGVTYDTATSYQSGIQWYGYDCSISTFSPSGSSYSYTYYQRPNMRITGTQPADIYWTPVAGLYKSTSLATALLTTDTNKSVYASPATTTSYQTYAYVQGCTSNLSNPDTVFVNPAPNVNISPSGTQSICFGDSITFSVPPTANVTYTWKDPTGATIGTTTRIRVAIAGRYSISVQNIITGCTDTNSVVLVVNPRPVITVTASRPLTFCNGDSTTLTGSASSPSVITWMWSQNGMMIAGATNPSYTATSTGIFRAIGVTALGCKDSSAGTNVNVNTTPSTVTSSGSTTFCTGLSDTLKAPIPPTGTTYTYQWYNSAGIITGATSSSLIVSTSGNYYVTVTNTTTGCTSTSAVIVITVGSAPSSAITPAGAVQVCRGQNITLNTNPSAGLTYQWYYNGSAIAAAAGGNTSTIVINTASPYPATGNSYTVKVSIAGSPTCNSTTTTPTTVTVNPLPTPSVTPTAPGAICQGDSVLLRSNTAAGTTYQWLQNGGIINGATASTYAAKNNGAYSVKQTITTTGCVDTSRPPVNVLVNPLPVVNISATSTTTFCQGGTVTLNASPTTGLTFAWYVNGVAIIPAQTGTSYTVTTTGSYAVQATSTTTGCKVLSTPLTVQVNPKPSVITTPAGTANACQGSTTTISVPSAPGLAYYWTNATGTVVATTATLTTGTAGTYKVAVTNTVTGCYDTSLPVNVVINPIPTAVASIVGNSTICQRDSTKIKVTTDIGTTFQWYFNGTPITTATDSIHYAKGAGPYTAKVTSAVGCSAISNALSITVNPVPAAYITYNTPLDFCAGSAVVLTANSGTNITYQWLYGTQGSALSPNGNSGIFNITNQTGVYALRTTNQYNCSTTSDTLNVTVHPLPVPQIIQSGNTLQTSQPYTSYQWFYNKDGIGGATSGSYTFTQNGAYNVTVTDQYGCEGTSSLFFVNNVGVNPLAGGASIRVYPNPTSNILHIDATMAVKAVLRDVTGKAVIEGTNVKEMNLGDIASGMYLLYISDMEGHLLKAEKVTKSAN